MNNVYMIIDTEATGTNTGVDLIFEIAAIFVQKQTIIHKFHEYVNIPYEFAIKAKRQLRNIVDINLEKISKAESFGVVFNKLISIVKNYKLNSIKIVAHNIHFDYTILRSNAKLYSSLHNYTDFVNFFQNNQHDTIAIAKKMFIGLDKYGLSALACYLSNKEGNQHLQYLLKQRLLHTAIIDVEILTEIFFIMQKKNPMLLS